jgi:hypothetical protein
MLTESQFARAVRVGIILAVSDLIDAGLVIAEAHTKSQADTAVLADVRSALDRLRTKIDAVRIGARD